MKNENFIRVYDDVFSSSHCDELCKLLNTHLVNSSDKMVQNENTRKDEAISLGDVTGQGVWVTDFNEVLTRALIDYVDEFPVFKEMDFASYQIKVQKTKPSGGYHKWHCEQSNIAVGSRVLVWTVYLNDVEEGGETEFLYLSERIKPKKGSVMFFPASFTHTHRGNPPLDADKYIATGWYNLKPN